MVTGGLSGYLAHVTWRQIRLHLEGKVGNLFTSNLFSPLEFVNRVWNLNSYGMLIT
jgi:hypothetical protein